MRRPPGDRLCRRDGQGVPKSCAEFGRPSCGGGRTDDDLVDVDIAGLRDGDAGRAADRLGVTRSAVSQTIRKLEVAIGVALVRRTTRSASLTEAGDSLLAGAGIGFGMEQSFQPHLERGDLVPVLVEHLQRWRGIQISFD